MECEKCKEEIEEPREIEEIWNMHEDCIKSYMEDVDLETQIWTKKNVPA